MNEQYPAVELATFDTLQPYLPIWRAMRDYTEARHHQPDMPDQLWWVQHTPTYTLGQAALRTHLLPNRADIECVQTDRGGQVTYHGPGQWVAYVLIDLRRAGFFVKEYVNRLEQSVIDLLAELGLADACRKPGAPGIYLPWPRGSASLAKCAALGIKVRQGCAYHGVSLNVTMDLTPFEGINPCGMVGLRSIDLARCGAILPMPEIARRWGSHLRRLLWPDVAQYTLRDPPTPTELAALS